MAPFTVFSRSEPVDVPRPRIYLVLPSLQFPFRRKSTTQEPNFSSPSDSPASLTSSSTATTPSDSLSSSSRAPIHRARPDVLRCLTCSTEFALASQIVSKGFTGRLGRAYLVSPPQSPSSRSSQGGQSNSDNNLWNIRVGKVEGRALVTGWHEVADITCRTCSETVGWKYVDAKDESQKYKVGKFILETMQTVRHSSWEDDNGVVVASGMEQLYPGGGSNEIVPEKGGERTWDQKIGDNGTVVTAVDFDSEDEDECDEIFSGTWDPIEVANRRKRSKRSQPKFS